jgi:hypothetical protein
MGEPRQAMATLHLPVLLQGTCQFSINAGWFSNPFLLLVFHVFFLSFPTAGIGHGSVDILDELQYATCQCLSVMRRLANFQEI